MSHDAPRSDDRVPHWFAGFDFLRALFAVLVVVLHTRLLGIPVVCSRKQIATVPPGWVDWVQFGLLYLAVPAFMLISLFLFVRGRESGRTRAAPHIERLMVLFFVWLFVAILARGGIGYLKQTLHGGLPDLAAFLVTAGGTPYYFLLGLALMTALAEGVRRAGRGWAAVGLVGSCVLLVVVSSAGISHSTLGWLGAYQSPVNFLPYVFLACLLAPAPTPSAYWIAASAALFAVAFIAEWIWLPNAGSFEYNGCAIPPYTRVSVVAGAALAFLLAARRRRVAPRWVRLLSDHALGIYVLHPLIMGYLFLYTGPLGSASERAGYFAGVLAASLTGSILLRRILSHRLV